MKKVRPLEGMVIGLALLNAPLWYGIFNYDLPAINLSGLTSSRAAEVANREIGLPVRLKIEGIGVDSAVEQVGITPSGSMDVPKQPMNAGWYNLGARPGNVGSAVLAGHVDWYGGVTGVFADLDQLKPGDQIAVVDDLGAEVYFIVRETKTFAASADASEVFISSDGLAHLNLITCSGAWDKAAGQYTTRLVVFADIFTPPKQ